MIQVLIVDDQVLLRESLKILVEQDPEIKVVACAGNGEEAAGICDRYRPEVVLMDIKMPVCDGVEGTKRIKADHPETKVIILTMYGTDEHVAAALKNGADGYVLKDIEPAELITAIKGAAGGLGVMDREALDTVIRRLPGAAGPVSGKDERMPEALTERELEIVRLIVNGKSNKEIGAQLFLTEGTVKNAVTSILAKLGLRDRTQLAVFAVKHNIV